MNRLSQKQSVFKIKELYIQRQHQSGTTYQKHGGPKFKSSGIKIVQLYNLNYLYLNEDYYEIY